MKGKILNVSQQPISFIGTILILKEVMMMIEFIIIAGGLYGLYLVGIAIITDINYRKSRSKGFPRTRRNK